MNLNWKDSNKSSALVLRLALIFFATLVAFSIFSYGAGKLLWDTNITELVEAQKMAKDIAANAPEEEGAFITIINGAKEVKNSLSASTFQYLYTYQTLYNLICFGFVGTLFLWLFRQQLPIGEIFEKPLFQQAILVVLLTIAITPILGQADQLSEVLQLDKLFALFGIDVEQDSVSNMIFGYSVVLPQNKTEVLMALFTVGLVPAVGEELFFRGGLQKSLQKSLDPHAAIFWTALIFSAFHMDITGFFYRFFIGVLLGYILYWTSSIFLCMIIHALHNSLSVMSMYKVQSIELKAEDFSTAGDPLSFIFALMVSGGLLFLIYKISTIRSTGRI